MANERNALRSKNAGATLGAAYRRNHDGTARLHCGRGRGVTGKGSARLSGAFQTRAYHSYAGRVKIQRVRSADSKESEMSKEPLVLYHKNGPVVTVTLNRP